MCVLALRCSLVFLGDLVFAVTFGFGGGAVGLLCFGGCGWFGCLWG